MIVGRKLVKEGDVGTYWGSGRGNREGMCHISLYTCMKLPKSSKNGQKTNAQGSVLLYSYLTLASTCVASSFFPVSP